jgi:NitT/TauT family transport system permease protein
VKTLGRLTQFLLIYATGLGILWVVKISSGLSDYLIPPPSELARTAGENGLLYLGATLNTLAVAMAGHMLAILLATAIGLVGRSRSWVSSLTRTAAYNLQSYPIVAVAPIIFIFLGDGLASRLLIASVICYFPLLLSFIGIFAQPIDEIEHFFIGTGKISWKLELAVRTFENLDKLTTVIVGSATMAMVGTIVAEFLAATQGIGYVIRKALYQGNLATILVALFLIGLCSSVYISLIETVGTWVKSRLTGEKATEYDEKQP